MTFDRAVRRARLLMPSPIASDDGELIGRDPRLTPLADLRAPYQPEIRSKAIRAKCLDCCADVAAEVRKCTATDCALWPFRMGASPFRKSKDDDDTDVDLDAAFA